jgi:N-acetylneuraminic acid mutarotase
MPSITVPYRDGYDYGVGVDTPSSDVRNVAVTGNKSEIPDAGGSIVTFDMREVSTVSELNDVMGISASANGGVGLFSASARFNFSKNRQVNDSSVFLIVTVQVTDPFRQIKAPGISDTATTLLTNGQTQKFQDEFGDMFVRGLVTGGMFFGVIEVQTHESDERTKVSASLKASYGAFSADGSFDDNFHQTLKSHQTTVRCYIEGGKTTPIPTQVDTMISFATQWPDTVKSNAVPYSAILDTYSILPLPAEPNFIDMQHQRDVLVQCSILRDQDLQVLNNINYILSNPDQFVNPETFPLGQTRDDLNADLNTIAVAASNALDHPKAAALPQLKLTGPIALPKRKAGAPVSLHLQWQSAVPMPTPRYDLAAATGPDGRIYALGGITKNAVTIATGEAYDPQTKNWTQIAPMSIPRTRFVAVTGRDGRIYAIGGSTITTIGSFDLTATETVEAYDPQTNTWTRVASMSTPRWELAAAIGPNGRIYAIGGVALDTVEVYDPQTNTWTTVAQLPQPRASHNAVLGLDNRIYVLGGFVNTEMNDVVAYDPRTNTWTRIASMPRTRGDFAAVLQPDGRIYVFGGGPTRRNTSGQLIHVSSDDLLVDVYDPQINTWTLAAPIPTPRHDFAAAVGQDWCIYAIGGMDRDVVSLVEVGCG